MWLYKCRTIFYFFATNLFYFLFRLETTIYEYKDEYKPNCSNQTPGNMKISDTILVISVGSILFTNFEGMRDSFTFSPKDITRICHYNLDRVVN